MTLYATSCSSASFCVSVGTVVDTQLNSFPLVETYSNGTWSASLAPTPANADTPADIYGAWTGVLFSVSCPSDGECAAVGDYDAYDPSGGGGQSALLDNLSAGVWSTAEGALPPVTDPLVKLYGVSCPTTTSCSAVGDLSAAPAPDTPGTVWSSLLYVWSETVGNSRPCLCHRTSLTTSTWTRSLAPTRTIVLRSAGMATRSATTTDSFSRWQMGPGPLPTLPRRRTGRQVPSGLRALHSSGWIVHNPITAWPEGTTPTLPSGLNRCSKFFNQAHGHRSRGLYLLTHRAMRSAPSPAASTMITNRVV